MVSFSLKHRLSPFHLRILNAVEHSGGPVCVGLDPDPELMPPVGVTEFNRQIITATSEAAAAYKLQFAFYEQHGADGLRYMEQTVQCVRDIAPHAFLIADAKRCDVPNSARVYARTFFEVWGFDAVTVIPYIGEDGVFPFLEDPAKGAFIVCLTSNPRGAQFQDLDVRSPDESSRKLYSVVAQATSVWNDRKDNVGIVTGATYLDQLADLRRENPDLVFLVPGVGAQGGSADKAAYAASDSSGGGFLLNSSRDIIYASMDVKDYPDAARSACFIVRKQANLGAERKKRLSS